MLTLLWIVVLLLSAGAVIWDADTFAKHLAAIVVTPSFLEVEP